MFSAGDKTERSMVVVKRVYWAFGLLALLAALVAGSSWLVHRTTNDLLLGIDQVEQACTLEQFDTALAMIQQLQQEYTHKEHLLALFIKRDYLGSFRVSLAGLTAYAQPDSLPDLLTELAKARTQLLVMDHLFFSML